ncbi:MAG: Spy/CpxP family protein refolding chaperone [Acidobacteriota bacterium]
MKRMRIRPAVVLVIGLFSASVLVAQPKFNRQGHGGGHDFFLPERVLRNVLKLTDDQLDQVKALQEELKATVQPLREERRANGQELRAELEMEEPSATQVGELVIAMHDLQGQIRAARESFIESFKAILTPEQLEKFERLQERFKQRRHRRFRGDFDGMPGDGS